MQPKLGISEVKQSYVDGIQRCTFRRQINVATSKRRKRQAAVSDSGKVFRLDDEFYLLLGYGPVPAGLSSTRNAILRFV